MEPIDLTLQRTTARFSFGAGLLVLAFSACVCALGCSPEDGRDDLAHVGPLDQVPFAVTDFFSPSGQMGDGEKPDFIIAHSAKSCKDRPAGARGRCYSFLYHPGAVLWGGVYWAYPSNNWGSEAGRKFKPWLIRNGQLTQRYNQLTFQGAAERDTFVINLIARDSAGKTYTLRNATFTVTGPTQETITGDTYSPLTVAGGLAQPEPKALLIVKPGTYTVSLAAGWQLFTPNLMSGLDPVTGATLAADTTSFTIAPGVDAAASFDFTVGTETLRFTLVNPTVGFNFFAGDINDPVLRNITCPDPGQVCEHRDLISTAKPVLQLSRAWQSYSVRLLIAPPCVGSLVTGMVESSKFADSKTGVVACATGTLTADGRVANCPPGKPGILEADGQTITCCETPLVSGVCNGASTPGSWVYADDIIQTVIGGFGWATNYAEFEAQNAVIAGSAGPMTGMTNVGADQIALLPSTTVYLDDIVWDFVTEPAAATP